MASFPLVANEIRQPESPLDQYAKVAALRNAIQQQQLLPGQLQAQQQGLQLQQQQVQEGQLNLERTKAMNDAFQNAVTVDPQSGEAKFNTAGITQHLAASGAGAAIPGVLENIEKFQQGHATLQKTQAEVAQQSQDYLGAMAATIKAANYDPVVASSLLGQAAQIPAFAPKAQQLQQQLTQNPNSLQPMVDQLIAGSAKQRELGASETTAAARQLTAKTEADKFAAQQNPQSPLYSPTPAAINLGTAPGAQQIQAGAVRQAGRVAGAEASAKLGPEEALEQYKINAQKQLYPQALQSVAPQLVPAAAAQYEKASTEYAGAKAAQDEMSTIIADARAGNKVAYSYAPTTGVLTINSANGVKRVNMAEIRSYAGAGSVVDRIAGFFGKQISGASIPPDILNDMQQVHDDLGKNSQNKYANEVQATNATYGSKFTAQDFNKANPANVAPENTVINDGGVLKVKRNGQWVPQQPQ